MTEQIKLSDFTQEDYPGNCLMTSAEGYFESEGISRILDLIKPSIEILERTLYPSEVISLEGDELTINIRDESAIEELLWAVVFQTEKLITRSLEEAFKLEPKSLFDLSQELAEDDNKKAIKKQIKAIRKQICGGNNEPEAENS